MLLWRMIGFLRAQAVCLGTFGSMWNHHSTPNVGFTLEPERLAIRCVPSSCVCNRPVGVSLCDIVCGCPCPFLFLRVCGAVLPHRRFLWPVGVLLCLFSKLLLVVYCHLIRFESLRDIAAGEECCISYGSQLWFTDVTAEDTGSSDEEEGVEDPAVALQRLFAMYTPASDSPQ